MSESEQEKKNKRIAAISTAGITVLVFILLFVIIAWRAPDPPLPEYGIEINFGTDATGFGEVQPRVSPGEPEPAPEEEVVEEVPEESEPVPPVESVPEEQPVVSKVESPVTVKEEEPKKDVPPIEEPVKKEPEPVREPVKEPVKETPKPPVPKAVYKPNAEKNDAANSRQGDAASHGDDPGRTGDKGNEQGSVDAKALYGKPGGGAGGSSLDLAGWEWDAIPSPSIPTNEPGGIVKFEIKVNERGEIISIKTNERGVLPETEQACRKAIERLTFSKTGENVPSVSTGTITFVIRSR